MIHIASYEAGYATCTCGWRARWDGRQLVIEAPGAPGVWHVGALIRRVAPAAPEPPDMSGAALGDMGPWERALGALEW